MSIIFKKVEKEDCRNNRPHTSPQENCQQVLLEIIFQHMKEINMTRKSAWIYQSKTCLTNLIAFCND